MGNTNLIKVRFLRDGQPSGREYTYISKSDVEIGDTVQIREAEEGKDTPKGIVTAINVPESEVESFRDKLKAIVGKVCVTCETCENCIPIGEGDHICGEIIGKVVLVDYTPSDDYMCCGGKNYVER